MGFRWRNEDRISGADRDFFAIDPHAAFTGLNVDALLEVLVIVGFPRRVAGFGNGYFDPAEGYGAGTFLRGEQLGGLTTGKIELQPLIR